MEKSATAGRSPIANALRSRCRSRMNKEIVETHVEGWIEQLVNWYAQELRTQAEIHIACYEAFLAAARNARHRAVVVEWFDAWRQSAELALRAAGSPEPRRHAELFVSTLIGILLQQLAAPRRDFRHAMKAALSALVNGLMAKP